ncbi:MAG: DUF4345 domain-containing protein [Chthoniobacterales bacterium]
MKRALQIIVAVLSLLPLGIGTLGFIFGASLFLAPGVATPKLDSQFRFLSAADIGLALVVWWIIPRIEYQTTLFRMVASPSSLVAWGICWPGVSLVPRARPSWLSLSPKFWFPYSSPGKPAWQSRGRQRVGLRRQSSSLTAPFNFLCRGGHFRMIHALVPLATGC